MLPESVVTQSSIARVRHVVAHELAHLARGDLWTNWLLLTARVVHWFNPVAWWTVGRMQAEREAACDELAFSMLGETDRRGYAATMVDLVLALSPSPLAPGLVGLVSSTGRLQARVERFLHSPSAKTLRAPIPAALLVFTALLGLTDALPPTQAQPPKAAVAKKREPAKDHTESGRCLNQADHNALAGVTVRLYRLEGRVAPPVEIAKTVTDAEGRYTFEGLVPPRPYRHFDRLIYGVFGFADDLAIGIPFFSHSADGKQVVDIWMTHEKSSLSGRVIDAEGRPIAGARVLPYFVFDRPAPDLLSATTDADGRFTLNGLGVFKWPNGNAVGQSVVVRHPDYPDATAMVEALPADLVVTMQAGCIVTGTVVDKITGQPAEEAMVTARRADEWHESFASTDAAGHFRLVVPEGRYDFLADATDRVCIAVTGRECLGGESLELPQFTLIGGGAISGRVINTATGEFVSSERGEPIMLGLYGPSQPTGKVISPVRLAEVDETGRFVLRAAPGENFPYFVNTRGDRMAWDTRDQPPVVVKEGETTEYDMLITPPIPPEEKLKAAQKLVDALPKKPSDRTARILGEFRKLNHTVDETELWCMLMRELVAVGQEAVPQLCAELDRTTENRMLRRLGFALRAIGDPRAVPALIRAIPKTLLPSSSDYGLIVNDRGLADFMQTHDLAAGKGGEYFDLGRPPREIFGALHALTQHDLHDSELFSISLSEDARRQVLQRRIYLRQAQRWQAWWEANWKTFTNDAKYQQVKLQVYNELLPPAPDPQALPKRTRLIGQMSYAVLSPASEQGAWHFYDLDAGFEPGWPAGVRQDETAADAKELTDWAFQMGADLMCVTYRAPDGKETYVLKALGMKVWEITPRDLRNLDKLLADGALPEGRPVDNLLMHYDTASQQFVPDANGVFLFITHDGNMGVIETTDRVTRVADLTGVATGPPPGTGFHKGVRFNLSAIIP